MFFSSCDFFAICILTLLVILSFMKFVYAYTFWVGRNLNVVLKATTNFTRDKMTGRVNIEWCNFKKIAKKYKLKILRKKKISVCKKKFFVLRAGGGGVGKYWTCPQLLGFFFTQFPNLNLKIIHLLLCYVQSPLKTVR